MGCLTHGIWYRAKIHTSFADMLGSVLHRGLVDVGFLGGLEIDAYGNLNTTLLGDPKGKFRRFTGSGGGNDVASSARRTVVTIRHEARKLNEAVAFITSPGYLRGGDERHQAGPVRRPQPVDHRQGSFRLRSAKQADETGIHHPNTTLEDVLANMSFKPIVPEYLPVTEPPTPEQVRLIHEEIDPHKAYAGG